MQALGFFNCFNLHRGRIAHAFLHVKENCTVFIVPYPFIRCLRLVLHGAAKCCYTATVLVRIVQHMLVVVPL
jgi:hypothetical protein